MRTLPDFIFICTDQQRSDSLGCYGNTIANTPNIDAIAATGIRFDRHITPMQICSPSRATMITGLYPRHHKLAVNGMALPHDVPLLTEFLANAGYKTHSVGKQHLQPLLAPADRNMPDSRAFWKKPESVGWHGPYYGYQTIDLLLGESDTAHLAGHYADWLNKNHPEAAKWLMPESADEPPPADLDEIWVSKIPAELHYNTWITDRAVRFLNQSRSRDAPFFLFVSYPDPHHPFDPVQPYASKYPPTAKPELYNQTVSTDQWRFTVYPHRPQWGELFDLDNDPGEHFNLFNQAGCEDIQSDLSAVLASRFPPQPTVDNPVLCKW